jgi:hypothetical protein
MALSDFICTQRVLLKPYWKIYNIFAFIDSITSCDMEFLDNIGNLMNLKRKELKIINKACILNYIKWNEIDFSKCTELQEHD